MVTDTPDDPNTERFGFEVPELTRMFTESEELTELVTRWESGFRERWQAGRYDSTPGRITIDGDEVRLECPIDVDDDGTLDILLIGTRVDRVTAQPPY